MCVCVRTCVYKCILYAFFRISSSSFSKHGNHQDTRSRLHVGVYHDIWSSRSHLISSHLISSSPIHPVFPFPCQHLHLAQPGVLRISLHFLHISLRYAILLFGSSWQNIILANGDVGQGPTSPQWWKKAPQRSSRWQDDGTPLSPSESSPVIHVLNVLFTSIWDRTRDVHLDYLQTRRGPIMYDHFLHIHCCAMQQLRIITWIDFSERNICIL